MTAADLHLHSSASDGEFSPRQVVQMAKAHGLDLVALTDHDTLAGVGEALVAGEEHSVTVIPGIELSTKLAGEEVHILGYYVRPGGTELDAMLANIQNARVERIQTIVKRLQELGFALSWPEVLAAAEGSSSIGRPHVAKVMVEKGYATSIKEVFSRWIGAGCPAYVPRYKLSPTQAINLIHLAGGLAFLAHPGLLHADMAVAENLVHHGLDGLEVFHSEHSPLQIRKYLAWAQAKGLYVTGGSDWHGHSGDLRLGQVRVPIDLVKPWIKD
ncbi:MAG: PHP domain-containing protein [Firmicutes bacterium]|nr:PHP domain-containing protein [Bacillota bacterium]HOB34461.1 PHP domain-containing protein [Bacillota bacterium]HPZ90069.1 PHP domain-containing protein [Bacillota bacterium]HQE01015.1 PHP domain-containing protein [Bacillota bacterium]